MGLTVGNTKLRFHDLRHVYGTWLHEQGVGKDMIQILMGRRDSKTTERYISPARLIAAREKERLRQFRETG